MPRPVQTAELEHPPGRPERDRRHVPGVVADVLEGLVAQLLLELSLGDGPDLPVDAAELVDAPQRPPRGGVLAVEPRVVVVGPRERRPELRAHGDEAVQLHGVADRPRRHGRERDDDEQRRRRQRAPRPARPQVPRADRERQEQDEPVGAREDRQAGHEARQEGPAELVPRSSQLDRGRQRAEHEHHEQRLGHERAADEDERQVDRAERERRERLPAPPELRSDHPDQRDGERPDERLHDARRRHALVDPLAGDAGDVVHPREQERVAGRSERRRELEGQAVALAARYGARVVVVVARVVHDRVVGGRRDVPEAQHQRHRQQRPDGEAEARQPAPAHAAGLADRTGGSGQSTAGRRRSVQLRPCRSAVKRARTPSVSRP